MISLATCVALAAVSVGAAQAGDSAEDAAATAEVYVYGLESKNEALLREISDPDEYEAMAKDRAESKRGLNENVRVSDVELIEVHGDRAVARATYTTKHKKGSEQADVQLKRVNGKWEVTTAPEPAKE